MNLWAFYCSKFTSACGWDPMRRMLPELTFSLLFHLRSCNFCRTTWYFRVSSLSFGVVPGDHTKGYSLAEAILTVKFMASCATIEVGKSIWVFFYDIKGSRFEPTYEIFFITDDHFGKLWHVLRATTQSVFFKKQLCATRAW